MQGHSCTRITPVVSCMSPAAANAFFDCCQFSSSACCSLELRQSVCMTCVATLRSLLAAFKAGAAANSMTQPGAQAPAPASLLPSTPFVNPAAAAAGSTPHVNPAAAGGTPHVNPAAAAAGTPPVNPAAAGSTPQVNIGNNRTEQVKNTADYHHLVCVTFATYFNGLTANPQAAGATECMLMRATQPKFKASVPRIQCQGDNHVAQYTDC